jgi:hypothetical protein
VTAGGLHEPISQTGYAEFKPHWTENRGVADSGAALYLPQILQDLSPRTLIVQRDREEVVQSIERAVEGRLKVLDYARLEQYLDSLEWAMALGHPLIKRVAYHDLTDLAVMRGCMAWLGVNPPNLVEMMHMRVTTDVAWNIRLAQERAA